MSDQAKNTGKLPFDVVTLADAVIGWKERQGDFPAFTYLQEGTGEEINLNYSELDDLCRRVGARLQQLGAFRKTVLLAFPPGQDFLVAFIGCLYAGAIAVPVYPPDPKRLARTLSRFQAIAVDCEAEFAMTNSQMAAHLNAIYEFAPKLKNIHWFASDNLPPALAAQWKRPPVNLDDFAFLQYTSGSTGTPKGVMVSHRNLNLNCEMLAQGFQNDNRQTLLTWLPNYHDMGLIDGLLKPFYLGCHTVVMAPTTFLKRPAIWLESISKYRAHTSGGPNFAYELCVKKITDDEIGTMDLSCWVTAYNGAEPVRPETMNLFAERFAKCGFRHESLTPGYGLAEATLYVSSCVPNTLPVVLTISKSALARNRIVHLPPSDPDSVTFMGSGRSMVEKLAIVDPDTGKRCTPDQVGEIWVSGPSIAMGYWKRPDATAETFQAVIADTGEGPYMRTGDLGFVGPDDELFITGRMKDLIIIRGRNHYPQDIEKTIERSHPAAFRPGCNAAFSIEIDGEEKLVVVQELQRRFCDEDPKWAERRTPDPAIEAFAPKLQSPPDKDEVIRLIRQTIAENHGLQVHAVMLIKPGSIHKTSSGKIQRRACKSSFLKNELEVIQAWREGEAEKAQPAAGPLLVEPAAAEIEETGLTDRPVAEIRQWLREALAKRIQRTADEIDDSMPFAAYGLDSKEAVAIVGEMETWLKMPLSATLLFDYPNVARLTRHLGRDEGKTSTPRAHIVGAETDEPIAVIGLGCRFPGADNPREFWRLLCEGREVTSEIPPDRWDVDEYYDPDPLAPGKMITRRAGFLKRIDEFDPEFFGITPREAARMDPQQRLLLEVVWEALDDAGLARFRMGDSLTGVFVGIANSDFMRTIFNDRASIDPYFGTGSAFSIAANRISYLLDLKGPSVALDTACSSSLVAVHLAIQSLRKGECSVAIAGGVNLILSPEIMINFSKAGVMSPEGRCKPFDDRADGYARGEGAGAIVLKPFSKAVADNDPIYAVLLGSAVNSDGRSNGLMAPNGVAQEAVIAEAWRRANRQPNRAQYIEAHGTGTKLGDPIEVGALAAVVARSRSVEQPLRIGSVKSNFGHLEAAAGIAGLMKVVLSLHHRQLPPTIHYRKPNPAIPFDRISVRVQTELAAWPAPAGEGLAGVSSFGFGGTNSHVVLAEAPVQGTRKQEPAVREIPAILPVSAPTDDSLHQAAERYAAFLTEESAEFSLTQLAASAAMRRDHHEYRLAMSAESIPRLQEQLAAYLNGETTAGLAVAKTLPVKERKAVFVYQGQGAQWWAMSRELLQKQPVFRAAIEQVDALFRPLAGWSLMDELLAAETDSHIHETRITQPVLFAVQVGLTRLWQSYGIEPAAVVGHSMGEVTSAYVSGAIDLPDAVRIIYYRGHLMEKMRGTGAMAAVEMPLDQLGQELVGYEGRVSVAVNNGPTICVIGGEPEAVDELLTKWTSREIFSRKLRVDVASHCIYMEPIVDEFVAAVGDVKQNKPTLPIVSTVTGEFADGMAFDAAYFGRNLRQTVLFRSAMKRLIHAGYSVFLELNVHPVLLGPIKQNFVHEAKSGWAFPTLHRTDGELATMFASLAWLHCLGFPVKYEELYPRPPRVINLPATPTDRKVIRLDLEAQKAPTPRATAKVAGAIHPFLHRHIESPSMPMTHIWEADLDLNHHRFLVDHQVLRLPVFPATGYLDTVRAAAIATYGTRDVALEKVELMRALVLSETEPRRIQVAFLGDESADDKAAFKFFSRSASEEKQPWTLHIQGSVRILAETPKPGAIKLKDVQKRCKPSTAKAHYESYDMRGIHYGPMFQGVRKIWHRNGEALGLVQLPQDPSSQSNLFDVHPALLDACLQLMGASLAKNPENDQRTFMPVGVESYYMLQRPGNTVYSHVALRDPKKSIGDDFTADISLLDKQGGLLGKVIGLKIGRLDPSGVQEANLDDWLFDIQWREMKSTAATTKEAKSTWLVVTHGSAKDRALVKSMVKAGRQIVEARLGENFRRMTEKSYRLNLSDRRQIRELLDKVAVSVKQPLTNVIYVAPDLGKSEATPEAMLRLSVDSSAEMLAFAQEMTAFDKAMPMLWLISHNAQSIGDAQVAPTCEQSTLWGLGRTLLLEFPEIWGGMIDLDEWTPKNLMASAKEIANPDEEDQIAWRAGKRYVARLCKHARRKVVVPLRCSPNGSYLITGGLGALGLAVAQWLAEQGAKNLVLTARSKFPPRDQWKKAARRDARIGKLMALEKMGVQVQVAQADVADAASMKKLMKNLAKQKLPLRGVVHAAGIATPKLATELTRKDLQEEMKAKVKGTWVLHQATAELPLDFFILYSSAAAVWGSKLLAHYSAANHFLDSVAYYRRAAGLCATSLNWGMWGEAGMSADEENKRILSRMGLEVMAPALALQALGRTMAVNATQCTVAPVNWSLFKPIYQQLPRRRLLDEIVWQSDEDETTAAGGSFRDSLLTVAATDRRVAMIEEYLIEQAAKVLGISRDRVNNQVSFTDQGMDSLTAGELRNRLETALAVKVNVLQLLRDSHIERIAAAIEAQIPKAEGQAQTEAVTIETDEQFNADIETLDADIDPANTLPEAKKPPKEVLLTGTTGYLGSFVLAELLKRPGVRVHCLARAKDENEAGERIRETMKHYGIWKNAYAERIVPVPGDLALPRLGLNEKQWERLAKKVDAILHVGYLVNFLFTYRDLRATNVLGTKELMRLAATHRVKPLHFVSSFSVYLTEEHTGKVLDEYAPLYHGEGAYRETKRASERLIDMAKKRGLPISIYRPPFISWQSKSGSYNEKDYFIRLMLGCLELGAAPDIDLRFHLAPVDFVARALVQLAYTPAAIDGKYNVIGDEYGTPWAELVELLHRAGAKIKLVPYPQWREKLSQAGPSNPLHIFFPMFTSDLPERGSAVMEIFNNAFMPERVHSDAMLKLLPAQVKCPDVDRCLLEAFLNKTGMAKKKSK